MRGVQERILLLTGLVAGKAALGIFLRVRAECENEFICSKRFRFITPRRLLSFDVRFAGPVARLTGHRALRGFQSRVGCFVELNELGPMAASAGIATNKICTRCGRRSPV